MVLTKTTKDDVEHVMQIIETAKKHLKEQGIDQWQDGYPDIACITADAETGKGYFFKEDGEVLGYICIDFDGEPAYDTLEGEWACDEKYVVGHRMAMSEKSRGKNYSSEVFSLLEQLAKENGVNYLRVDTDEDNKKMQHVFIKNGFVRRGKVWYNETEKVGFDKRI